MVTIGLNSENFEQVTSQEAVVLVDAWAPWCGPCRGFAPVFEKASADHPDCVFAKLNTEQEEELRHALSIQQIPTLIVYREGMILYHAAGSPPARVLEELIAEAKALDMDEVRARKRREAASEPDSGANPSA